MKRCSVCGADIREDSRYCDQCGAPVPGACEEPPRDFWAERLAADAQEPEAFFDDLPAIDPEQSPYPGPQPKRRRWVLAVCTAVLVAVLVTILAVFALDLRKPRKEVYDPNLGTYYGVTCTMEQTTLDAGEDWVELKAQGRMQLSLMESTLSGTWQLEDGKLILTCDGQQFTGTLTRGIMELESDRIRYTLAKPGAYVPEMMQAPENYDGWAGDYYGWWSIYGQGAPEDAFWDVCGRITVEESTGQVELWDTTCRFEERLCRAEVEFLPGSTPKGCMQVQSGQFQGRELEPGDWDFDPGRTIVKEVDGAVMLLGDYGPGEQYLVFLMPWGMTWDAVEQMKPEKKPYEDMLPYSYESWYLPKIQAGKPMPDAFPKSFLEKKHEQ